jgi:hypothetical protein
MEVAGITRLPVLDIILLADQKSQARGNWCVIFVHPGLCLQA